MIASSSHRSAPLYLLAALLSMFAQAGCDSSGREGSARAPGDRAEAARPAASLVDGRWTPRKLQQIQSLRAPEAPPVDESNEVVGKPGAIKLGERLFFDTRLSSNGEVSCASCHKPEHGFSTPDAFGRGLGATPRHPPTLLNVAHQRWFDWDGKADSLWAQALRPLESEAEHDSSRLEVLRVVAQDSELRALYAALFGELPDLSNTARFPKRARPVPENPKHPDHLAWMLMSAEDRATVNRAISNVTKALAAYQHTLLSYNAPFDRYAEALAAQDKAGFDAISEQAKRGLELFLGRGLCVNCHNGPNFSDMAFHNLGLPHVAGAPLRDEGRWAGVSIVRESPFSTAGELSADPKGKRAKWLKYLKQTPEDHGQFKTPTLRNVARTPPYMHAGQFATLEQVIGFYNAMPGQAEIGHREEMLQPIGLRDEEQAALVAFLKSLNGDLPEIDHHREASGEAEATDQ